jgi:hypothetical protein
VGVKRSKVITSIGKCSILPCRLNVVSYNLITKIQGNLKFDYNAQNVSIEAYYETWAVTADLKMTLSEIWPKFGIDHLRAHRAWSRCHFSKLFIDGQWHRVTPDYAMTKWRKFVDRSIRRCSVNYVRSPEVCKLGQFGICLSNCPSSFQALQWP